MRQTIAHSRLIEDLEKWDIWLKSLIVENSERSPCMWILHFLHHSEAWRWSAARSASHFVASGLAYSVRLAQLAIRTYLYSVIGCVPDLHESQPAFGGIPANLKPWWWMKSIKYHCSPNKFSDLYLCCLSGIWEVRPNAILQSSWTFKTSWNLCPQCLNTRKALGSHERTHGTHAKTRFMMYI